jgi:hypothetical protein
MAKFNQKNTSSIVIALLKSISLSGSPSILYNFFVSYLVNIAKLVVPPALIISSAVYVFNFLKTVGLCFVSVFIVVKL